MSIKLAMNYSLLLIITFLPKCIPKLEHLIPSTSTQFTTLLLQNIKSSWISNENSCSLHFILPQIHHPIDWNAVSIIMSTEPFQLTLFSIKLPSNYSIPIKPSNKKHKFQCTTVIIAIYQNTPKIIFLPITNLGNPKHDYFIFISNNVTYLHHILTKNHVITRICHKYAMISHPNTTISYLIDPIIFTGHFEHCSAPPSNTPLINLKGRALTFMYLKLAPLFVTRDVDLKGPEKYAGFYWQLHKALSTQANYTLKINDTVLPPGSLVNGQWSGLMGKLLDGSADMISGLGISKQRFPFVDYTTGAYSEPVAFCVREPSAVTPWQALLKPLSPFVWLVSGLCLACLIILTSVVIYLDGEIKWTLFMVIMIPYGTLLEQAPSPSPIKSGSSVALRLTCLLCLLFSFLIGIAYKSDLLGRLTFPEKPNFPRTFQQLHEFQDYSVYFQSIGGIENELLRTSPNPAIKEIVKRFQVLGDSQQCLEQAGLGKAVCIGWFTVLLVGITRLQPGNPKMKTIYMSPDQTFTVESAPALRKGSILQGSLSRLVGWAKDSGLTVKMMGDYFREEKHRSFDKFRKGEGNRGDGGRSRDDGDGTKALNVRNFVAINVAYIVSLVVAVVSFFGELACRRRRH